MQLYATDHRGTPLLAIHAEKGSLYTCPECASTLRLRGGPHRQPHFYHVRAHPTCRQHGKTIPHLTLQLHLKEWLGGRALLEHPFPTIGRIADVVWEEEKMIFEVQCSPISQEEASARTEDYATLGYRVIWILSDQAYGRKKFSSAEAWLRAVPCYYFSRTYVIYDRFEVVRSGVRLFAGPKLPVDLRRPMPPKPLEKELLPQSMAAMHRPIWFRGDLFDRFSRLSKPPFLALEEMVLKTPPRSLLMRLGREIENLFSLLLIRSCS